MSKIYLLDSTNKKHYTMNLPNFLLTISSVGLVGEFLHNKEITGHPIADVAIKVVVPLISGVLAPLVKEYIDERKARREERKRKQQEKENETENNNENPKK
jgi:hypothetical protein